MADVSTPCAEYTAAASNWQLIEDAAAGESAIKAAKTKYLPYLNAKDKSAENVERNAAYQLRAVYYNATGRTLESLLGLAFKKDPEITIPTGLEDVTTDVDGAGTTLVQQAHDVTAETVKTGRCGLFVDFPKTDGNTSRADEQKKGIRPTISYYPAVSVTNWRTSKVGSQVKLSLVVLRESHTAYTGFEEKNEEQYRVLRLDGVYTYELWRKVKNTTSNVEGWAIVDGPHAPVDGNGHTLDVIPFTFIGSKSNTPRIDKAPLADIATLNVAHYRNSADYEDSVFLCGQPQPWLSGLDELWRDHLEEKGIYLGSRAPFLLPANGQAGMLQATANTLVTEALATKEKQMAALGARLIVTDGAPNKTATQQQSEDATANSVLSLCCNNVSAAYTLALTWCGVFANVSGEIEFAIPTDFSKYTVSPEEITSLMGLVQAGHVPQTDLWSRLRLGGVIDPEKTDDMLREEMDSQPVPGNGLDDTGDPAAAKGGTSGGGAGEGGDGSSGSAAVPDLTPVLDKLAAVADSITALASRPIEVKVEGQAANTSPALDLAPFAAAIDSLREAMSAVKQTPIEITIPQMPAPVVNVAAPTINVAPPSITIQPPQITVNTPDVNVAPAAITVEAPQITVTAPNVTVEQPDITVPLTLTVEKGSANKTGKMVKNPDGSFSLTVEENPKA